MRKKIAIIGCGRVSGHHCRSLMEIHFFQLVAVCDLDIDKAKNYGVEFNVPYYINYHNMLKVHPEVDIVAVITPSGMHYEHTMDMLENYKKHVIVEKPTFLKSSHLKKCYETANKLNLKIFPVFQNRYNLAVQKIKNALENNELGQIRIASIRVRWCRTDSYYALSPWRGTYSMDGGALTNQGVHHIDLLRYLAGEVESVSAKMNTFGSDIEVEDTVVAHVTFKTGSLGAIEITTAARPDNYEASLSLVCANGLAQIGGIAVNELQIFTPNPSICGKYSEDFSGNVYGNGHFKMYQDIAKYFESHIPYPIFPEDNLGTLKLLHAIYASSEQSGKIVLIEESQESSQLGNENLDLTSIYKTQNKESLLC